MIELSRSEFIPVGVVGCGAFGRWHAAKYASASGALLKGVNDQASGPAQKVAAQHGVQVFTRLEDLAAQVEAVSIAAPASHHHELASFFLTRGVHVLVEKPIALSLADADDLIEIAQRKGLVLQVGHQERYVFTDMGLMSRGISPKSIDVCRTGPFTGRGMDVNVVLDLMIHDLDLLHQVVHARIDAIEAVGHAVHGNLGDEAQAILHFEDGCVAKLLASRARENRRREMKLVYDDGVVEIDFIRRWMKNSTSSELKSAFRGGAQSQSCVNDPLGYSIGVFLESIRSGAPTLVTGQDARHALETALMITKRM